MIELSHSVEQVINPGETAVFDTQVIKTGCNECHRKGTGSIKLRAHGSCQNRAVYEINFNGNVTGGAVELAISLGDDALPQTSMQTTTTDAAFQNVSAHTFLSDCCDGYDRIAVKNVGTVAVTLAANPSFTVKRFS